MRIDDLSLFFKIECLTIFENNGLFKLIAEVLLIARSQGFWVGIPHEFVCASSDSASSVPLYCCALD